MIIFFIKGDTNCQVLLTSFSFSSAKYLLTSCVKNAINFANLQNGNGGLTPSTTRPVETCFNGSNMENFGKGLHSFLLQFFNLQISIKASCGYYSFVKITEQINLSSSGTIPLSFQCQNLKWTVIFHFQKNKCNMVNTYLDIYHTK